MKTVAVILSVVAAAVALEPCLCTYEYNPVCGSDGRTYGNLCGLKCEQRKDSDLTLAYHGECDKICYCTKEFNPVCGTDAVTYDNICLLGCTSKHDASVGFLYEGACKKRQKPLEICTIELVPICGSDGISYGNKCQFDLTRRTKKDLYLIKYEEC